MINSYVEYITVCGNLQKWIEAYYEGKELVDDGTYDFWRKATIAWEEQYPETKINGSPTYKVGFIKEEDKEGDTKHTRPMLSLENALDSKEAQVWIDKWKKQFDETLMVVGEFKYNGLAASVTYVDGHLTRVLSRGDGEYGKDITATGAQFIKKEIQAKGVVEIRGEIILDKTRYKQIGELNEYANALSTAVAIVNSNSKSGIGSFAVCLSFIPYDITGSDFVLMHHSEKLDLLRQLEFYKLSYMLGPIDGIHSVFNAIKEVRDTALEYEIDGVVFKVNELSKQVKLGATAHHPLHSFAYKFPPLIKTCIIRDVTFQVGRSGEICPVAKITPTTLQGVVVTSVSLHNEERLNDRKIAIGNSYEIFRAGDVIPHLGTLVMKKSDAIPVVFPTNCPCCSNALVKRGVTYYCDRGNACKDQLVASIAYVVSREVLDIDGLAEKTISMLVDADLVKCPADLYDLTVKDIEQLDGYSQYSAEKLYTTLALGKETSFDRYIAALCIPGVAKSTARNIAQHLYFPEILFSLTTQTTILELKIPDIGPVTAMNIASYFSNEEKRIDAWDLFKSLRLITKHIAAPIDGVTGKTFVFTGTLSTNRFQLANKVLTAGGFVRTTVNNNTDYLVVGEGPSGKVRTAELLQIEIIDENVFLSLFENTVGRESDFKQLPNGLYVGYHAEGGETFDLSGNVPLTMETLHDDRPLFLSYSKDHWFAEHLPKGSVVLYEIHFVLPKQMNYSSYDEYQKVNPGWDENNKVYISTPKLTKLISEGYNMFSVGVNEIGETPESFIINPTKYVKDIIKIS